MIEWTTRRSPSSASAVSVAASRPGRRLEVAGPELLERPEQLAVPGQLGLAAQVRLDERLGALVDLDRAVDQARAAGRRHPQTARDDLVSSYSASRSRRRPRCSRTFAADTEIPSSSAIASWGSP